MEVLFDKVGKELGNKTEMSSLVEDIKQTFASVEEMQVQSENVNVEFVSNVSSSKVNQTKSLVKIKQK